MSKFVPNTFSNLNNETSFLNQLNENFSTLQTILDSLVSRDGTSPNTLTATLDFNGQNANNIGVARVSSLFINGVEVGEADAVAAIPASELANGSAAAPSLYFTSDTDTGFYRTTTNQISATCGGSQVVTFSSAGVAANGGISGMTGSFTTTCAVGSNLTVGGNATVTGNITVSGTVSLPAFALNANTTATTQSANNNSTKVATTAYVDNAVAGVPTGTSVVRQTPVVVTYSTQFSGSSYVYLLDGSTPAKTEGKEIMVATAYTPTANDSVIIIEGVVYMNSSDNRPVVALFKDTTTAAEAVFPAGTNADTAYPVAIPFYFTAVAGSTAARDYKIHVAASGSGGGNIVYVNRGSSASSPYGTGKVSCVLKITEVAP